MKRRTFLGLLAAAGMDVALGNLGALALPPGQDGDDAEMPDGYQVLNQAKGLVVQWGTMPLGMDLVPHLEVAQQLDLVYSIGTDQAAWLMLGTLKGQA
jgi:hypothetical protein